MWRWKAFPTSRSCGVSSHRRGSSWCANGSSWNVVSGRSLRKLLSFPFFRPSVSTTAMLFTSSSRPFGRTKRERISDGGRHAVTSSTRFVPFAKRISGRDRGPFSMRCDRSGAFWHGKSVALEPFSDDAVAAADQQDCAHRRQCKREGRSHLVGTNVEWWSRRPISTSLVVDECLWAAVFRLNGWLVCGCLFLARGEETRGLPSLRGGFLRVFLHVDQSALGSTLVNSLLRFYGLLHRHRSKRVKRKKESSSSKSHGSSPLTNQREDTH